MNNNQNNKRKFYSKNNKNRNNQPLNTKGSSVRPQGNPKDGAAKDSKPSEKLVPHNNNPNSKVMSQGRNHFRRHDNNQNHNQNQNRDPFENLYRKYEQFLELHILARKKYFEMYGIADQRNLKKLEQTYHTTQKQFYEFEKTISPEQKQKLAQRIGEKPLDLEYSTAHNLLNYVPEPVSHEEKRDPHILDSQIQASFKHDTEETIGSI